MNILYLSCHSILEHDEVKLFHQLGFNIFSPGAYIQPWKDNDMRPGIPGLEYDPKWVDLYNQIERTKPRPDMDGKNFLTKELIDCFDTVIVMHRPDWIEANWPVMKHKRVIWRTIGQSVTPVEFKMRRYREQGMQIVRYSGRESCIPGYAGADGLIRFYKDPDEYYGWTGEKKQVINFTQDMQGRSEACGYQHWLDATEGYARKLYGPGNDQPEFGMGKVDVYDLNKALRQSRVYFYTGTQPASYTLNFIEAAMTGIPIVAIGPALGNGYMFPPLYEIHELIQNGISGFCSDNIDSLRWAIGEILDNYSMACRIGMAGRDMAIKHFGKDMIGKAWHGFLNS